MGPAYVTARLSRPNTRRPAFEARFLVDTGAIDSLVPKKELRRIGVRPVGRKKYELADGRTRVYAFGIAQVELMGRLGSGFVIFGPDDAQPLLGVTVLESAGLTIDPGGRVLKRLPAVALK